MEVCFKIFANWVHLGSNNLRSYLPGIRIDSFLRNLKVGVYFAVFNRRCFVNHYGNARIYCGRTIQCMNTNLYSIVLPISIKIRLSKNN